MIKDSWRGMLSDPLAEGYELRMLTYPKPDRATMAKCRKLCEENLCGAYDTNWGCPPGTGTGDECLDIVHRFSNAAVIMKRYGDIDFKNTDQMSSAGGAHQDLCRRFCNKLRSEGYDAMIFSDGGCKYCGDCSYPDDPCRFPDQRISSISAYGIILDDYLIPQGIDFKFENDAMTLYGLILYNDPE